MKIRINVKLFPVLKTTTVLFLSVFFLEACAPSSIDLWQTEVRRGWNLGFRPMDLPAPPFRLAGLLKGDYGEDLVVYLEGDGRAVSRGRANSDPTPRYAQGLRLALVDSAPLVLYLARVGQYMPAYSSQDYQTYWTGKRLSIEVVRAAGEAIDSVKARVGAKRLHLVGYSGGGGLAVLLAEVRADVASLVTVAGLLDIDWWVKSQGYLPLSGSLNPANGVEQIKKIPQIHFYGQKDIIIPPEMSARFADLTGFAHLERIGLDTDHWSQWTTLWPELLENSIKPLRNEAGFVTIKHVLGPLSGFDSPQVVLR